MKKLILFFTAIGVMTCLSPTKEELKLINELNAKFPDYVFAPFASTEDVYIKLNLKKEAIDTLELKNVYKQTMLMNQDSLGNSRTPWLYIIVYDKNGKYLFTMRDYGNEFKLFRDKIF